MKRDLTVGSVPKQLIRFAIPLFLANLFQSLYNIVDMVVVGRFVGSEGLAAVSSALMISFIITSLCMGITMGGSVLVAHYIGAHEARKVRITIGNLFSISAVSAVAITIIGLAVCEPALSFMRLPQAAYQHAVDYVRITCLGTVFIFAYNSICSILRGLGDSRNPLIFVAIATVANIVLDILFVGPLGWGVKGAASATIISQGISVLIALRHLKRHDVFFHFSVKDFIQIGRAHV
jgi:putative MATE family efflux protein